jgi:hypothetical protein
VIATLKIQNAAYVYVNLISGFVSIASVRLGLRVAIAHTWSQLHSVLRICNTTSG